jgi:hypothetical protein
MAQTHAVKIPSLDELLSRTAPGAHAAVIGVYDRMDADASIGKTRKQCREIGGWGQTTQISKEKSGVLQAWNDGTIVRVGTVSLYLHIIDLIIASHPVDGPPRKARVPTRSYTRGHRRKSSTSTSTSAPTSVSGRKEGSPA